MHVKRKKYAQSQAREKKENFAHYIIFISMTLMKEEMTHILKFSKRVERLSAQKMNTELLA